MGELLKKHGIEMKGKVKESYENLKKVVKEKLGDEAELETAIDFDFDLSDETDQDLEVEEEIEIDEEMMNDPALIQLGKELGFVIASIGAIAIDSAAMLVKSMFG